MTSIDDLQTPALLVDLGAFDRNVSAMSALHPGPKLRPHVKAFKSTALARRIHDAGHAGFCAATVREMEGMADAGLGADLLLANEVLDHSRLTRLVDGGTRVTVAVDSDETIKSAAAARIREVLIDVNVGMPRCGCAVSDAGRLADTARAAGLKVRGVMGYEGHLMMEPSETKPDAVETAMGRLRTAHDAVGGDVISGGGTGTALVNNWVTEIQAGSYTLMDTDYAKAGLPFEQALFVSGRVVSVESYKRWAVADVGLKALAMDHGDPSIDGGSVWFCSDEHLTFEHPDVSVGDLIRVAPAHVDPTVAKHDRMWVVDGDQVVDEWPIDLKGW